MAICDAFYALSSIISGESTPISLQSSSWSKKHGGFLTNHHAIWRHLTPYLWQRLKVVTASQAQFWARGSFHTPLDDMLIFFAVNFFCQWEWFWWIFWDFYDLFKDVQVIHYILGLGQERKINKVLKMSTIARFLMRNTSLDYLKFCI